MPEVRAIIMNTAGTAEIMPAEDGNIGAVGDRSRTGDNSNAHGIIEGGNVNA
jgi:hypothetical protein